MAEPAPAKRTSRWRFLSEIGPGIIAGAADDDPSGIATYSSAGAALGTSLLWTALITWPLMAAVQFMCARIGMVTGRGLAGAFHHKLPRPLIAVAACALFLANTINVGADLSGMADAGAMFTGFNSRYLVFIFGIAIAFATIQFRYQQIATILKWLALVLFAYVITALMVGPDWKSVLHDTFVPSLPRSHQAWSMLVAILGTTISPYLFFWQASQEVEEKKAAGRRMLARRQGRTRRELEVREIDVGVGTFFSNLVMYFIILTTALTLHRHGIINIETSKDAAEALRRKFCRRALRFWCSRCRLSCDPNTHGFRGLRVRRNIRLASGPRREVQICPGLLCRCDHFHFGRHRTRFCESKPGARTFLDRSDQRTTRAFSSPRRFIGLDRSQTYERSTKLADRDRMRGTYDATHVRCGHRDVHLLKFRD